MMFVWVLGSGSEVERYLDVMYIRLCGLRLFSMFSKVYYIDSLNTRIKDYILKMFGDSSLQEFEDLDVSEVSSISVDRDILIVTIPNRLDNLLNGMSRFLEFESPALLIISFEGGYPVLNGLLSIDLFKFIEV